MKLSLLLVLLASGCAQKYQNYPYINKKEFIENQRPAGEGRPAKMMAGRMESEKFCAGQVLFLKDAQSIAESSLPALVAHSCPGSDYLLNAKITKLWWTTLLYTRACVKVDSFCPKNK